MDTRKFTVILACALVGWALCAATMGIGMAVASERTALFVHAALAPVFFGIISYVYHRKFLYTAPLATAVIFTSFVILVDFFLVALVMLGSLDMFRSILGTWIPFALIFVATYVVGHWVRK